MVLVESAPRRTMVHRRSARAGSPPRDGASTPVDSLRRRLDWRVDRRDLRLRSCLAAVVRERDGCRRMPDRVLRRLDGASRLRPAGRVGANTTGPVEEPQLERVVISRETSFVPGGPPPAPAGTGAAPRASA